jgi:hypothetical protein
MSADTADPKLDDLLASALESLSGAHEALEAYRASAGHGPGDESPIHAHEYAQTAALLRRRAQQPHRSEADRTDLERRASWFEARAAVKRSGALMPRELRTPLEGLQLVDDLRHALLDALTLMRDLSPSEVDAFQRALDSDSDGSRIAVACEAVVQGIGQVGQAAGAFLQLLGVRKAENGDLLVTPVRISGAIRS